MTNKSRIERILQKARPYIKMHGGDVILLEEKKGTVTLKIYGACVGCTLADLTYNEILGTLIKERIPKIKKVIIV